MRFRQGRLAAQGVEEWVSQCSTQAVLWEDTEGISAVLSCWLMELRDL